MGAVDLLEQHDARELVGKREGPEREAVVHVVEVEPLRPADDEAQVAPALAALLDEAGEVLGRVGLAPDVEQGDEGSLGDPLGHALVLAQLDHLHAGMTREQLLVVLDVVREGGPEPADGQDDDPHAAILGP